MELYTALSNHVPMPKFVFWQPGINIDIKPPYVVKAIGKGLEHKTELGAVRLNVLREELNDVVEELANTFPHARILIQEMVYGDRELLVSVKKDSTFGYSVVVGSGGIYVEVLKDVEAVLCPFTLTDLKNALASLKTYPILRGTRGKKPLNVDALYQLTTNACSFAQQHNLTVLEFNPVITDGEQFWVVDVKVE